jgi:MoaA/NifB/PqqE/SkfB family radical SAM enzyme
MPSNLLATLGYLSFEIGSKCNLSEAHQACPINHMNRTYEHHIEPPEVLSFVRSGVDHGFRGHVAFHYYNEPMMKIMDVLEIIRLCEEAKLPVKFLLWSNGLLIPRDKEKQKFLNKFDKIVFSQYFEKDIPFFADLCQRFPQIKMIPHAQLDDRAATVTNPATSYKDFGQCMRQALEMIIRSDGEIHHCCIDYGNEIKAGNILRDNHDEIISRWQANRDRVSAGDKDQFGFNALPSVCKACVVKTPHSVIMPKRK